MKPFNKLLFLPLVVALAIGGGVAVAAGTGGGSSDPAGNTTGTIGTTTDAGVATEPAADVKGPCDEAEHANDPRCSGAQVPEDQTPGANDQSDDIGNDDAAEVKDQNDDNSGPGSDSSGFGSGEGSSGSDHGGHSGHGGGDDD